MSKKRIPLPMVAIGNTGTGKSFSPIPSFSDDLEKFNEEEENVVEEVEFTTEELLNEMRSDKIRARRKNKPTVDAKTDNEIEEAINSKAPNLPFIPDDFRLEFNQFSY